MRDTNYKLVGVFVVAAVALGIGMLIFVGGGRFFSEKHQFVAFFEGTLSGLRVGAPVAINGVPVGSVYDIKVEIDGKDGKIVNPVFVELERDKIRDLNFNGNLSLEAQIDRLVLKGLRAQLRTQSIVTGMLYIELGFYPRTPTQMREYNYGLPQLPTVPSPLQELKETLDNLKVQDIFLRLGNVLVGLDKFVNSPELTQTTSDLRDAISEVKIAANQAAALMTRLNQTVEENHDEVVDAAKKVAVLAESLTQLSKRTSSLVDSVGKGIGENSSFRYELNEGVKEVSASARAVRELAEYLKRNPNSIVTGKRN